MKYYIVCKHCGTTLMKTREPVLATLRIEIKCPNPNCKKLLYMPEDVLLKTEGLEEKKEKRPGLD